MTKIFVSWSGDTGRRIAEALKETLFDYPGLELWVSSHSIDAGAPWFDEIERAAKECDAAIGCMTPGAARRPWVNFEAGMLYGRLRNFKMLLFGEQLSGPLANLQALDGTSREHMGRLLKDIINDTNRAQKQVRNEFERWIERVNDALRSHAAEHAIASCADRLRDAAFELSYKSGLLANEALRTLLILSLGDLQRNLSKTDSIYKAPQLDYPVHLIEMQKTNNAKVKAIALLQQKEQFWQQTLGRQIRDTALPDSERVFVVASEEQLDEHWETILGHARAYNVAVLSYDELARWFEPRFVRDFSILEVFASKVVAAYDDSVAGRIQYMGNPKEVRDFEAAFDRIVLRAIRIDRNELPDQETFKRQVFTRDFTPLDQKPVEMSQYVPIDDYDSHEEEHLYYVEMMDQMLAEFSEVWRADFNVKYRVLEMGAGTGIFTRRIAKIDSIDEVVALEIDWACHTKLKYNVRTFEKVKPYPEDSRRFNPSGRFHAVFSSFADHHIKTQDKVDYLRNVKRNLCSGGVFIVGDEFLRPHDPNNDSEREAALRAYHSHIIEAAEQSGNHILVALETAAMESGINKIGDFKVSCVEYENHLRASGFTFVKRKIGPADPRVEAEIGGVYVYVARVEA
jgi:SAM-dependent methyltransferase